MIKSVSKKLLSLVGKTSTINQQQGPMRLLVILICALLILGIIIGTGKTALIIGYIIAFFTISHLIIKLSSIAKPSSDKCVKNNHNFKPLVSIHVACKNEPAEIVIKTVEALSRLDYERYEVLVINSNNTDRQNWQEIEKYVKNRGKNFKFVHLDKIDGFKAGALNYLNVKLMDKAAEIAAIVDCDYIVKPDFLNKTVGYFSDPIIGIVQAPQDYYNLNRFNIGLYYEYRSFFELVMHQAQQLSLVTFTGTMGLIRTSLLDKGLKWNEWCITEDVEAGTYINSIGYRGVYVDERLGVGLMPYDYASMIKQRQRWAFGNMQIIRKDFIRVLINSKLLFRQKLAFFAQLATWFHFEYIIAIAYLALNIIKLTGYSNNIIYLENLMLTLLTLSVAGNLLYFTIGLRGATTLINRLKAFLSHYGLLYVMATSWITCILGRKLGFIVTDKVKSLNNIPFSQYSKEFTIIAILLIGLGLKLINGGGAVLDMSVIFVLIAIESSGIFYLRKAFIESNRLVTKK
jgi:cellulose synthase/poly-beta-1,6-N-acetylglucosamine synthase-like glycosyltransferase